MIKLNIYHGGAETRSKTYQLKLFLCGKAFYTVFAGIFFFGFFIVPLVLAANETADLQQGRKELQGIRTEIKEKKKDLANAGKKEKGLLTEIQRINKRLVTLEKDEIRLDRDIIMLEKGLQEKDAAILTMHSEISRKKMLLSKRLIFLYKSGDVGYLEFILSSEGSSDESRRQKYMTAIAANDRNLIKEYGRDVATLFKQMEALRADKVKYAMFEEELEKKRAEIKREKEERDRLLLKVRKEKRQYKESLKDLEANARNLQLLMKKLERETKASSKGTELERIKRSSSSMFEIQKGALDFPVKGEVIGLFGKELDKDSKTTVFRKGIEIKAGSGTPIRAVYHGRVIYSDNFKGFGLMIIIDHGEGYYTLYAHASKLLKKVNDEINKGDIIGEVGESGTTGEPSLYFEVRKGGKPENPLEWLKS